MTTDAEIEDTLLRLAGAQGVAKSICPSDVARTIEPRDGAWQPLLSRVRGIAIRLAGAGQIDILRKGKPVPGDDVRGVIRLRLKGSR